jgi:prepilin-type N-terminal cleavage/methylation domain-containing protein
MRADRGFTLLETLLALAIGGLLLTAAYAAVVRAAAARDASLQRTGGVVGARRALLEMASTLETSAGQRFGADAHAVHVVQPEPEPRLVRYALDGSRLVESTESAFAAPGTAASSRRVLLDAVEDFRVRCFDGGDWTEGWNRQTAPRAVELMLRTANGEELRTRVLLPLGGGG